MEKIKKNLWKVILIYFLKKYILKSPGNKHLPGNIPIPVCWPTAIKTRRVRYRQQDEYTGIRYLRKKILLKKTLNL
jgi:hypothetical protein